jgi:subtilase family serine protease
MRTPRPIAGALCAALAVALLWSGTTLQPGTGPGVARSFRQLAPASATTAGAGLTPADIASAYALTGGTSGTVAIATAYSDPYLEADLGVYRSTFDLDPCTTASGCLTIVGQTGSTALPNPDAGWGEETSLDVDAVSAACPGCRILVVEASSDSIDDLGTAVNTAVRLGADAVSASWGDTEWSTWNSDATDSFTHPGVPIVAATGDGGNASAVLPAALPTVIAVGGTTLTATAGAGRATPLTVHEVQGGTVTAATTSATVAADKRALAKAKAALTAAKHRLTAAKQRLHRAKVQRAHAVSAHAALHWKHRVRDLGTAVTRAAKAAKAAAARVSAAESTLLKAVLRDSRITAAAAARTGQTDRADWIETAWSGAGSGCSAYVPRPAWQPGTTCTKRGTADVAADADPQTGIASYDTYGTSGDTDDGWMIAGGTSLASPLVAAMLVRSGHASAYSSAEPLYGHAGAFWDVTGGSNGACATALCRAGAGYDGPTGVGSPRSLDSF